MKNFQWPIWPKYDSKDKNSIIKVLSSNRIYNGNNVQRFESSFKNFNKSKYAVCIGNGTQGLHLALASLNIGDGDEVIVTNFSWISSASCILMQGATPVFCDIEKEYFGLDPIQIKKKISSKTKAIIVVHMFGVICKIDEIHDIAKKNNLYLIEDCSHSHGAKFKKKYSGNFGDIGVFSLHQRKNIPSGEGGIIVTKHKRVAKKIYQLRSFGAKELSYNYRMSEFSAVLAKNALKKLNKENEIRNKNASYLKSQLKKLDCFKFLEPNRDRNCVYYKFIFYFKEKIIKKRRKDFIDYLNKIGIPVAFVYRPLNEHSHFNIHNNNIKNKKFPITNKFADFNLMQIDINSLTKKKHLNYFILKTEEFLKKNDNTFFN